MAILLLTVAIRVLLLPLTAKQTKSMLELQRIQPKIKELQEKYKNDKEKLQEETLTFYKENKVNPFGGCLPVLLQSPILFALYGVLAGGTGGTKPGLMIQYFQDTNQVGHFYSILPDLSITPQAAWGSGFLGAIPYVLAVIIFGVSIWLPQALMPGDKQQKSLGAVMAVVMLAFGWSTPAGVLLYWDISSIWGIAQQQLIMVMAKKRAAAEDAVVAAKKAEEAEERRATLAAKKASNKKTRKQ
ncbi:MAG: YidC/Oxa1 family membrane protein insertase [Coriobacteriia bacterium]|nr:YidC/Oxa1 family membrane protein insertase [Coriobacteriia bacterium]